MDRRFRHPRAPNNQVAFGWCDNVENMGENWISNGTWGVVQQPDSHNSMTINAHSGGRFWSDSPRSNYVNNSSDALEMQPWLVLPADAVEPQLVFWQQWDINSGTTLAVEIMRQSTGTWEAPIWSMSYNSRPPGYNTVDSDFNRVLSWQRTALNLDSYRGDNIKVRFRRKAGSNNANGWWLDDICFESRNETTWTLPFINRMDSSASWYRGGTWAASAEEARSNGIAFSDSPGRDYTRDINDILELRGVIDPAARWSLRCTTGTGTCLGAAIVSPWRSASGMTRQRPVAIGSRWMQGCQTRARSVEPHRVHNVLEPAPGQPDRLRRAEDQAALPPAVRREQPRKRVVGR